MGISCIIGFLSACSSSPSPWTKQSSPWDQRRDTQAPAPAASEYKQELAAVDQTTSEVELSYQTEQVESVVPAESAVEEPAMVEPEAAESVAAVAVDSESVSAEDEILNQPADYYTVQLFASVDIDRVYKFAEQNQLSVRYVVPTVRDDVTWNVLLLDIYPTLADAKAGLSEIEGSLSTKPWIRSLGSLQKLMR